MLTINIRELRIPIPTMVVVAQLVRASDCDSEGRGFESPQPPCRAGVSVPRLGLCHPNLDRRLKLIAPPLSFGQMRSGKTAGISRREFLVLESP